MRTVMTIECPLLVKWFPYARMPYSHVVEVPEPYQAGDTPSETFIDSCGIPRERLKQYGQQPRVQ